jgi:hypothetical protein
LCQLSTSKYGINQTATISNKASRAKKDGKAPFGSKPTLAVKLARCSPAQAG